MEVYLNLVIYAYTCTIAVLLHGVDLQLECAAMWLATGAVWTVNIFAGGVQERHGLDACH